jgi:hypothetical protein
MSKILTNNDLPRTKGITLQSIKEHKLFKEEFTVDQIVDMCSEDKDLEQLYTQHMFLKGMHGLTDDREVA